MGLADVEWFIAKLDTLHGYFDRGDDIVVARAPGRLDVLGGIADYSGSLMLEMPIAEATFAAVQKNSRDTIEIASIGHDGDGVGKFEMKLSDLVDTDLAAARTYFSERDGGDWAGYIGGVFFVLATELGIRFDTGAKIAVASQVPIGKGVSSSAALEISVMQAVCSAYQIEVAPRELAMLCQKVENHVVGAPCGVMDQMSCHFGQAGKLMALVCQPADIRGWLEIPDEVEFWGIDSGVRHAVSGSDYSSVRIGAFMGYRIIADLSGLNVHEVGERAVEIDDEHWRGYLSNVGPDEYEVEFQDRMPRALSGQTFLAKYHGTTDRVTSIDPQKTYAIKAPTEHAIYENWRVNRFAELIIGSLDDRRLSEMGKLMFASHASYKACGLTESRTDRIVGMVKDSRDKGLFGAHITGGGSGGTVAVLARRGRGDAIAELTEQLADETGETPYVFHGSSPGCDAFGTLRIRTREAAAETVQQVAE